MKTKNLPLAIVSILSCCIVAFSACKTDYYDWTLIDLGNNVNFHTQLQTSYLLDSDYANINAYAKGTAELSRPEAIKFTWASTAMENAPKITSYELQISTDSDFKNYISYTTQSNYYDVHNLYVATEYYWRVEALLENGKKDVSQISSFTTSDLAPRNIYVDGVTNVRDLGGWTNEDGLRVKQGMIYRCGRLNTSISDGIVVDKVVIEITDEGINTMRNDLGIKSEIDLRRVDNNEVGFLDYSPLGSDVNYYSCPMNWNVSNILTGNVEMVKQIFSILANEDNYPLIYHCNIGTDRTGLFAFLINGLMGVSEEDLYRDYLFSNFGKINSSRSLSGIQNSYVATIKNYSGDNLREQIFNCLTDLGIPDTDIIAVQTIMS